MNTNINDDNDNGIQSIRTHGRFVPRLRRFAPTFGQFVLNPLVDSYPTNCCIKFLELLSEKLVKMIKMKRSHAQGSCVISFVILANFT